jgi:hypothetical protein
MRSSDVADICYIIQHFFTIHDEEIWEHHSDLFALEESKEEYNETELAAQVLGRKIGTIAQPNEQLVNRLQLILTQTRDKLATAMTKYLDNAIEESRRLLVKILTGMEETVNRRH